ncbi:MAG: class I SAM-dependent methyltransferase, partial [Planctomycetota bacterium]|nr:class I SAM-dependent methyltransferase [Planctomycetota bacterium]
MKEKKFHRHSDPRIAFFDHHAGNWDADDSAIDANIRRLEELRGMMGLQSGQYLLEIGCGTGQITPWFCSAVAPGRVVAVDFSQAMLAKAQSKGIDADFRLLDICSERPEGRFDLALCFHSFPHFRDQKGALANISAVLKPGGELIVMHLAGSGAINAFHSGVGGAVESDLLPSEQIWPDLLDDAGLKLAELIDHDDL